MTEIAYPSELALSSDPIDAVALALFAVASGDHNPLHLDADVARAAGFDRPVVHGMLTMACVARLFTREFGAGCIRSLETRFTGAAMRGDTLQISASRVGVEDGVARYDLHARTAAGVECVVGHASIAARVMPRGAGA